MEVATKFWSQKFPTETEVKPLNLVRIDNKMNRTSTCMLVSFLNIMTTSIHIPTFQPIHEQSNIIYRRIQYIETVSEEKEYIAINRYIKFNFNEFVNIKLCRYIFFLSSPSFIKFAGSNTYVRYNLHQLT